MEVGRLSGYVIRYGDRNEGVTDSIISPEEAINIQHTTASRPEPNRPGNPGLVSRSMLVRLCVFTFVQCAERDGFPEPFTAYATISIVNLYLYDLLSYAAHAQIPPSTNR